MTDGDMRFHRPLVAADVVLFTAPSVSVSTSSAASASARGRRVLLIVRGQPPFEGCLAFPGGLLEEDESLVECARRELFEETGVKSVELKELGSYSNPSRDPRGRCISVAYFGVVDAVTAATVRAGDDAADAGWYDVDDIEPSDLAFDHWEILKHALARIDDDQP
jgi:8-oxo-dGTP diphosphatase